MSEFQSMTYTYSIGKAYGYLLHLRRYQYTDREMWAIQLGVAHEAVQHALNCYRGLTD